MGKEELACILPMSIYLWHVFSGILLLWFICLVFFVCPSLPLVVATLGDSHSGLPSLSESLGSNLWLTSIWTPWLQLHRVKRGITSVNSSSYTELKYTLICMAALLQREQQSNRHKTSHQFPMFCCLCCTIQELFQKVPHRDMFQCPGQKEYVWTSGGNTSYLLSFCGIFIEFP